MKVASFLLHSLSHSLGSTVRVRELAISLGKLGVETCIFTPYEKERSFDDHVHVKPIANVALKLGLSSLTCKLSRFAYYNGFFFKNFFLNESFQKKMSKSLANVMLKSLENEDVDIIQAEQDITILPCMRLRDIIEKPLVVDLHNLTPEELVAAGILSRDSLEFKVLQQWMKDALSQLNLVVVVSEEMRKYVISEYDLEGNKVIVIPPAGRPRIKNVKEKSSTSNVVYAGLVAYREHVDLFVRAMPPVVEKKPDARFYITKKGEDLRRIQRIAKQLDVHPEYFWYVGEENFYRFLASCDVGTLPSSNDLARKMGTPVKLFDYLSVGLPVVANDIGAWTNIIKEEKIGLLSEDNSRSFSSVILQLLQNTEMLYEYGRRGLELISKRYNWDAHARILLDEYEKLLNEPV